MIGFFPWSGWFALAIVLGVPLLMLLMLWIAVYVGFLPKPPPKARAGLCRSCGYDLTGNRSRVCPECGGAVSRDDASA